MFDLLFLYLQKIIWKKRLKNHNGKCCLVTIDGVDFPIYEPTPFDFTWYSHKFRGAGVCYEIAVAIKTGDIVVFNGHFECGK